MFQFRFVLLALLIPVAGAAALLGGTGAIHGIVMPPYEATSSSAASAAAGAVAIFASNTVDAAAVAASDPDVANALVKKKLSPKAEAALLAKSGGLDAPNFAFLVGVDGVIVGKSGADPKLPDNVAGMSVVAEALRGLSRDGFWMQEGVPVHLAASACFDNDGALAGAVVLGWVYTQELVASFERKASAPTFVVAGEMVVGNLPLGVAPSDLVQRNQSFGEPTPSYGSLPILVPDTYRYQVTSLPLYPGEPIDLVTLVDRDAAYRGLAGLQAGILSGTGLLLLLVLGIIASALRAMNRPIELITEHLSQVQQHGGNVGILPEAGLGPMLRLGKQINLLLQTMPSSRGTTAPLFGNSASTSQDVPQASNSPFGGDFASMPPSSSSAAPASPSRPVALPISPSRSMPPQAAKPAVPPGPVAPLAAQAPKPAPVGPAAPAAGAVGGGLLGLFDDDPLAAFRVPQTKTAPPAAPPVPELEPEQHTMQPEATVMFQMPEALLQASSAPSPAPRPAPPAAPLDDNRTVVAQVPHELLAQVSPKNDVDAADEAHYKEVYEKFVQTRIECGEDTSDLTFDRFVSKLLKNRQQIIEKHKAKSVRFQVYAKDGKAALRALPVRD